MTGYDRRPDTPGGPPRRTAPGLASIVAGVVLVSFPSLAGVSRLVGRHPSESSARAGAGARSPVSFVTRAVGVVVADEVLRDRPSGGQAVADVPGGTAVEIAGTFSDGALVWRHDAHWVRLTTDRQVRLGFLDAGGVALTAGAAPPLEAGDAEVAAMVWAGAISCASRADDGSGAVVIRSAKIDGGEAGGRIPAAEVAGGGGPAPSGARAAGAAAAADGTGAGGGLGAGGAVTIPWLPATVRRWEAEIVASAARHGVDPNLVAIVTLVESGGNPQAVSPSGAVGLMQVMPATALDIAGQRGIAGFAVQQLYDPATAIDFGAWYLARMLATFGSADDPDWAASVTLAAAAYNGGPGTVQRYLSGGSLPAEAERYKHWVGTMWRERLDADSTGFRSWWDAGGRLLVAAAGGGA